MTSICNYSHPELQITEGLTRQTSGILFPYNPEFYKLASELYGPGTIYCWYLLIISVIINWLFHEKDDKGYRRPPGRAGPPHIRRNRCSNPLSTNIEDRVQGTSNILSSKSWSRT
jgi:hypothetical protein